jgi:glycerate 2-kinase
MFIKNRDELGFAPLRRFALDICEVGIRAVLPSVVLPAAVDYDAGRQMLSIRGETHNLRGRVFVVGGGKASGAMAETLENLLPEYRITDGVVTCKGGTYGTRRTKVVTAGHPVPDIRGVHATGDMLALKARYQIGAGDTVICLLSGGGSALLPAPIEGISLADKQLLTELLLASGAEIKEINLIRKHLSRVKGGRLGRHFAPAQVITLIISDVIGNDLSVIASGPAYPDRTTFKDALTVLEKYHLLDKVPSTVMGHLHSGAAGKIPETPDRLDNCHNYIIADSRLALKAMRQKAGELGFAARIVTAAQKGETAAVARQRAREILRGKYGRDGALILGGETTPALPEQRGLGGRNQHFVAVSMLELKDFPGEWVVASLGTDGSDYLPDVAGAMADSTSWQTAQRLNLDAGSYLERYDSHTLLKALGGCLVITGETGTNVGDVMLYILRNRKGEVLTTSWQRTLTKRSPNIRMVPGAVSRILDSQGLM